MTVSTSNEWIQMEQKYGAANYLPLPLVIVRGDGIWLEDSQGRRYMDMLSAYSALNQGHRHPKIIAALITQAEQLTLTSRAFYNEPLARLTRKLAEYCRKDKVIVMNTGAEAVETAIKLIRRYGYRHKSIPDDQAELIVCAGNFHGRTLMATALSSHAAYKAQFGPFAPGIVTVPYGDAAALERAITARTAGILLEPIQGEAGIVIPPDGYLQQVQAISRQHRVLFAADEIQTGLGRTGRRFACDWEGVQPDLILVGKALGGGVYPVSAVATNSEVMDVLEPGSHGSTFGGNPLACSVALAALDVLESEHLAARSAEQGAFFLQRLQAIKHPLIKEVRGRGLFIGMELHTEARPICEALMRVGLLCKETHTHTIRFAPPLIITLSELETAIAKIQDVFAAYRE